jgi:hypothetical protein
MPAREMDCTRQISPPAPTSRIEDVIRNSSHRNPYTGEPVSYDAEARTIGFDCLANGTDVCAVEIGVWTG